MALALCLRPGPQDRLAGHVDLEFGRGEHLDAEDVVLAAVPRPERLGHRRDAEAEQLAPAARLLLLPPEVLVSHGLQPYLEALAVLAGVEQESERSAVGELLILDKVHPP